MKLIHHTISKLSIVMIIILTFWAGFFFYSILDEILDETDDSLENYKHLIIQQVLRDTAAINNSSDLMSQYFIKEIPEEEAIHYKERYFDSTRFYELEYDFVPFGFKNGLSGTGQKVLRIDHHDLNPRTG